MSGRPYGAIGCLVVFLLPATLLTEWMNGSLTWFGAATSIVACVLVLAVPLFLASRRGSDD
ncbi:hypothetical protein C8J45_11356 [Sphingomonas sp. PP-CE-3G-477]|nr:hypothetical protein C8J45_11356 [Sphingomonas sp. PP-CE-3G-477]